jgi:hypothetical protein
MHRALIFHLSFFQSETNLSDAATPLEFGANQSKNYRGYQSYISGARLLC